MSDTRRIEDTYRAREFDATDWSSPTRKNTTNDHGGIQVGYNYQDGSPKEILFSVHNPVINANSMVVLDEKTSVELLHHLNDLLGNPLSVAPTAGA